MGLSSLLYVSNSTIPSSDADVVSQQIVATAVARNPELGLTGALLFTGEHFAQVLEGELDAIDLLMEAITRDSRHNQVRFVECGPLPERRFKAWSMAYFGPSVFVSRYVTRLMNDMPPSDQRHYAYWLNELMRQFAAVPTMVGMQESRGVPTSARVESRH